MVFHRRRGFAAARRYDSLRGKLLPRIALRLGGGLEDGQLPTAFGHLQFLLFLFSSLLCRILNHRQAILCMLLAAFAKQVFDRNWVVRLFGTKKDVLSARALIIVSTTFSILGRNSIVLQL